jgi:putative SOS response-associated peptidase YedK
LASRAWWSKSLKELKLTTFNARVETVAEKPFFRWARSFSPVYYESEDTPHGQG